MSIRLGAGWMVLLVMLTVAGSAQTLAHKGWAGSGLTVDRWWRNATFYVVDLAPGEAGSLDSVTSRLDMLQALGVDALVLGRLSPKDEVAQEEAFGHLQQEAARRKIRLIADLPAGDGPGMEPAAGTARFWLTRGVGGLRMRVPETMPTGAGSSQSWMSEVSALQHLCAGFSGDRVLLTPAVAVQAEASAEAPRAAHGRRRASIQTITERDPAQLAIDDGLLRLPSWRADLLQAVVASGRMGALLVSNDAQHASATRLTTGLDQAAQLAVQKMVAAALFAGREAPLLHAGQEDAGADEEGTEPDPASLLGWYRTLSALRHSNATLHAGGLVMLDTGYPDVVAWVRRGIGVQQPVLVVCNLSTRPLVMSLVEPLKRVGLTASSGVRPLAISVTGGEQSYTASAIAVPPYGTYLGEVRQPGLEESATPMRSHRRRR